jgi:hypothetical protein
MLKISMRFNARRDMSSHHGPPQPFKHASVVADSLTAIHNAMAKCLFVVNRICIHGYLSAPTGKNPEDSNLASVEAMQWASSTYPSVMVGVIENISHSNAKMCRGTTMHVPHSFSDCEWYIFQ